MKIKSALDLIPLDKRLHIAAGFVIAVIVSLALLKLKAPAEVRTLIAVLVAVLAGFAKEAYDKRNPEKHTNDKKDIVATGIGGVIGAVVGFLVGSLLL